MELGYDFIIIAMLIMASLVPFYIYRKKVFKFYYSSHDIDIFKKNLTLYLKQTYPKIDFNFSIYNKVNHEKNSQMKQVLIAEDIAQQFALYDFKLLTQKQISKNSLWSSYETDSKPIKNRMPKDLQKRKLFACKRENHLCIRCGQHMMIDESNIIFVKPIENGGTFHFENIAIVCNDCNKILHTKDVNKISRDLNILDKLLSKTS